MNSTPLATLKLQRLGKLFPPPHPTISPEIPLRMPPPHQGSVPFPLTSVSFESPVLVSSGVNPHSHKPRLWTRLPFVFSPTLEDKKHYVRLDLEVSKH